MTMLQVVVALIAAIGNRSAKISSGKLNDDRASGLPRPSKLSSKSFLLSKIRSRPLGGLLAEENFTTNAQCVTI